MTITEVKASNIDRLIAIRDAGQQEDGMKKGFGINLAWILNNVQVSFMIDGVSILEYFFLRRFASKLTIYGLPIPDQRNFIDKNSHPEQYEIVRTMNSLAVSIFRDEDLNLKQDFHSVTLLRPIGYYKNDKVNAIFESTDILSLCGGFIEDFIEKIKANDMNLEDYFVKGFIKSFYSFMSTRLSNIDLLADFFMEKDYYQYIAHNETMKMSDIYYKGMRASFFGEYASSIMDDIESIKKESTSLKKDLATVNYMAIPEPVYHIIMNTDLFTFFFLDKFCPGWIKDHQLFKILLGSQMDVIPTSLYIEESIMETYNKRILDVLKDFVKIREIVINDPEQNVNRYNYLLTNQKIKFGIYVTRSQVAEVWRKVSRQNILGFESLIRDLYELVARTAKFIEN